MQNRGPRSKFDSGDLDDDDGSEYADEGWNEERKIDNGERILASSSRQQARDMLEKAKEYADKNYEAFS